MTYRELFDLACDADAKDPKHVCEIAQTAVLRHGENAADVLAQIRRSQPRMFYDRPAKPKKGKRQ